MAKKVRNNPIIVKPTEEEIKKEIEKLKEMKPSIRRYDIFGGDNWEKLDAEIRVLEEGMDEDDIYDEWPEMKQSDICNCAHDALDWVDGVSTATIPSEGWKALSNRRTP